MSIQLGTLAITSGTDATFTGAPNQGVKAIVIGNESGLTVTVTMESGNVSKTLYPSTVDWFTVQPGFSGNIKIHPITVLNNVSSWPASTLFFDAIGINDPEEAVNYPVSLQRNTNIGNLVSVVAGLTAASVANDGNPLTPSNVFIEAKPAGAASSTISIGTDGSITIKGDVASTLTTLIQTFITAAAGATSIALGDSARTTEILGKATVDGNLLVVGSSSLDNGVITTDGTGALTVGSAGSLAVQSVITSGGFPPVAVSDNFSVTGTSLLSGDVTANGAGTGLAVAHNATIGGTLINTGLITGNGGITLGGGTLSFLHGSIARISMFSGTATTTATNFAHGLGATPDIVLLQLTITSSTAHMLTYESVDGTNVKIQSDGVNTFIGLAIKF